MIPPALDHYLHVLIHPACPLCRLRIVRRP